MANGYIPSLNQSNPVAKGKLTGAKAVQPDVAFQKIFDETLHKPADKVKAPEAAAPQQIANVLTSTTGKVTFEQAHQLIAQAYAQQEANRLDPNRRRERSSRDTLNPKNVNAEGLRSSKLDVTPFQVLIDKSVDSLEGLSNMEVRVNDLIEQFIQGKVGIDEVSMETAKLNLAVSFATTVITTATQTFKEIQQIPI